MMVRPSTTTSERPYECHIVTPEHMLPLAMRSQIRDDDTATWLLQCVFGCFHEMYGDKRKRKMCMFGCGHSFRKGEALPPAFCVMLPMFPFPGRKKYDTAVASPICEACFEKGDLEQRLHEVLIGAFGAVMMSPSRPQ